MNARATIRKARKEDCKTIYNFIVELAQFEKAADEVDLRIEQLESDAFGSNPIIEIWIAELDNEAVGMALTYEKYSTWKGRSIHLEDLIVSTAHRGKGIGSLLFEYVVSLSAKRGYGRMEWQVLDWNTEAIGFYEKYGATFLSEWLDCRLTAIDLQKFIQK